ncbi:enoyl-CoA hydratase/isomerase family protein [Streptomyces sp. NPDC050315]|uniref:enoyl-CoA hydratase/isomerase family protein n=1 Tax=Streptomyces sp. NPDC050315 TaxID=3155039 RepID=UPI0034209891
MAKRPVDWSPLAPQDPTPGDPDEIRAEARRLEGIGETIREQSRKLREVGKGENLKGQYAEKLKEGADDLAGKLAKAEGRYDKVGGLLRQWANELEYAQSETSKARAQAMADEKDEDALRDARTRMNDAVAHYSGEGFRIAGQIRDALDDAVEDSLFDDVAGFVEEHADDLKLIGDLLSDLTGVLGMLAIITLPFPPLAAIFGTAALITGAAALAAHGLAKAGGADVSWMSIGLDAVGLLPGIGLFGKGMKVAGAAKAGAVASKLGPGFTATRIEGGAKQLFAFGKASQGLTGGLGKAGLIKIGGHSSDMFEVVNKGSGLMSRMGGVANAGYLEGQLLGSKGFNMIPGVNINPTGAGIAIDAGFKIAPKILSIPQHVGDALFPGDQFQQSAAAH